MSSFPCLSSRGVDDHRPVEKLEQSAPREAVHGEALAGEKALLERLARGERQAVDEAYRTHHAVLRAFAQRLLGERAAAEDLVHDVFVRLPTLLRRFRGESSLRSFLLGVAARLASRHVRSAARRRAAMAKLSQLAAPDHTRPLDQGQRERARLLYHTLDRLPLAQRAALVLCEVEERSAAEVASILGVPESTVRTRCFHARKKLAQVLGQEAP